MECAFYTNRGAGWDRGTALEHYKVALRGFRQGCCTRWPDSYRRIVEGEVLADRRRCGRAVGGPCGHFLLLTICRLHCRRLGCYFRSIRCAAHLLPTLLGVLDRTGCQSLSGGRGSHAPLKRQVLCRTMCWSGPDLRSDEPLPRFRDGTRAASAVSRGTEGRLARCAPGSEATEAL